MSFKIIIKAEARAEIINAFEWYESQLAGLGTKFKSELEYYLKRIQSNPELFQNVYKDFQHAVLKKFPFRIFFTINGTTIFIFGVFHTKRNPQIIARRIRKR